VSGALVLARRAYIGNWTAAASCAQSPSMIRVLMFVFGVIAFGGGLRECTKGERVITCTDHERGQQTSECYKKTKGTVIRHRGLLVELEGAGAMAAGLFFVVMALVKRK
jgi:hypothetical protein